MYMPHRYLKQEYVDMCGYRSGLLQVGRHARPFSSRPPRRSQVVVRSGDDIRGGKMEKGMFGEVCARVQR